MANTKCKYIGLSRKKIKYLNNILNSVIGNKKVENSVRLLLDKVFLTRYPRPIF